MFFTVLVIVAASLVGLVAASIFAATRRRDVHRAYSILAGGVDEFLENPCDDWNERLSVRVSARKLAELHQMREETAPEFEALA